MKAVFHDMQDYSSELDGALVHGRNELLAALESVRDREPFVCELEGDNGFKLTIGVGKEVGCVQHSPSNGDLPYLIALAPGDHKDDEYVDFLMGDTPSPISKRNILPFEMVKAIATHFLEIGERWNGVVWEEI